MRFKQLEITGFKSFSVNTTFLIEEGLSGLVGPNGCGKSNIVVSLRWCMGENSAKSIEVQEWRMLFFQAHLIGPLKIFRK